jgi:hypothetical protein
MTVRLAALLVAPLLASACTAPHAHLRAPDSLAPGHERLAAYESLRPAAQSNTVILQGGTPVAQTTDYLVLGDGQRVHHAEDLESLVPADSPTARAARRSREHKQKRSTWSLITMGVALVGASVVTYSLATMDSGDDFDMDPSTSGVPEPNWLVMGAGMGMFFGGFTGFIGANNYYGNLENQEKVSAFTTYERDLRNRLVLCVDGIDVVPCLTP